MPVSIHCPHDKTELQLVPENKGPEGLLECPKCGCKFRVCLAIYDKTCFAKNNPNIEWKADKKSQTDVQEVSQKRKRGRPPKNKLSIKENGDKKNEG